MSPPSSQIWGGDRIFHPPQIWWGHPQNLSIPPKFWSILGGIPPKICRIPPKIFVPPKFFGLGGMNSKPSPPNDPKYPPQLVENQQPPENLGPFGVVSKSSNLGKFDKKFLETKKIIFRQQGVCVKIIQNDPNFENFVKSMKKSDFLDRFQVSFR